MRCLTQHPSAAADILLMSNPFDSDNTKLQKTEIVNFSINNKQFSSNYIKKSQNNNIFFSKNPKNNNIILVISI